jgi:uncharacterized glyoxalase superfamily protein PhnB
MANKVKAVPDGYSTVTMHLVQSSSAKAIEFYQKAFGAEELYRMPGPDGMVMHAEVRIGNAVLMMADENLAMNPMAKSPEHAKAFTAGVMLYVDDVNAAWKRAVEAGAKVEMPLADMFWGDRYGQLSDPWGHRWSLAQHIEDVSPEEMQKRMMAMGSPGAK